MSQQAEHELLGALEAAGDKPEPRGPQDEKKNYAQRLSSALARALADALRVDFPTITPDPDGGGQESPMGVPKGRKRLDVKVMDPILGLQLACSIKTYSFQDYDRRKDRLGRWTKNAHRNDLELRGEAMVLHQRQPYAVLIALMFQPFEICDDATGRTRSSFAHHVEILAKRTGRGRRPVHGAAPGAFVDYGAEDARHELFERVFIGLYHAHGPERGAVRFFDVEQPPPAFGRPSDQQTLDLAAVLDLIRLEVARRDRRAPELPAPDPDLV